MTDYDFGDDVFRAIAHERERSNQSAVAAKSRVRARLVASAALLAGGGAVAIVAATATSAEQAVPTAVGYPMSMAKLAGIVVASFALGGTTHALYTHIQTSADSLAAASPSASTPMNTATSAAVRADLNPFSLDSRESLSAVPASDSPSKNTEHNMQLPIGLSSAAAAMPASALPLAAPAKELEAATAVTEAATWAERTQVEAAQAKLARGNSAEALRSVEQHAQAYPTSELREEREAIRIRALAALGRCDDARRMRTQFEREYHGSLQRASLQRLCPEQTR